MGNKVQLITYADRFGGEGISSIHHFLNKKLKGVFEGVHFLPFFYPIDGADAGYDPIDHTQIDQTIGDWSDVRNMSADYNIVVDVIVNHISSESKEFLDVYEKGRQSKYFDLFLTKEKVFGANASEEDINKIYRQMPGAPFTSKEMLSGEKLNLWTSFTSGQLDIDVLSELGQDYLNNILSIFQKNGVKIIRLDAVGYAIKKAGTSCFMLPETFTFIEDLVSKAHNLGIKVLVEIHGHFSLQVEVAKRVDYVYDFALPPLILHSIYNSNAKSLKKWLAMSPRNAVTVLDTHDGIGMIDAAESDGITGLLDTEEIDAVISQIHIKSRGTSLRASGAAASNIDLYQVNCTFYEALGKDDNLYYIARAIQCFSPGIPQIYYAGLLASENDMELLNRTDVGRDINRPYLNFADIEKALEKPMVQKLIELIKFRNSHLSFNGDFELQVSDEHILSIRWTNDVYWSTLEIDLQLHTIEIKYGNQSSTSNLT